jgi:hypothetical protein
LLKREIQTFTNENTMDTNEFCDKLLEAAQDQLSGWEEKNLTNLERGKSLLVAECLLSLARTLDPSLAELDEQ